MKVIVRKWYHFYLLFSHSLPPGHHNWPAFIIMLGCTFCHMTTGIRPKQPECWGKLNCSLRHWEKVRGGKFRKEKEPGVLFSLTLSFSLINSEDSHISLFPKTIPFLFLYSKRDLAGTERGIRKKFG